MVKEQQSRVPIDVPHRRSELKYYIHHIADLYKSAHEFPQFVKAFDKFNQDNVGYKGHTTRLEDIFHVYAALQRAIPGIRNLERDKVVDALELGARVRSKPARRLLSQVVLARVAHRINETQQTREGVEELLAAMAKAEATTILTSLGILPRDSESLITHEDEPIAAEKLHNLQVQDILRAIERGHLTL